MKLILMRNFHYKCMDIRTFKANITSQLFVNAYKFQTANTNNQKVIKSGNRTGAEILALNFFQVISL